MRLFKKAAAAAMSKLSGSLTSSAARSIKYCPTGEYDLYVGFHIKKNGDLYAAGSNSYGQWGNGTTTGGTSWTKVASNVVQVARMNANGVTGDAAFIVKADSTLWVAGYYCSYGIFTGTTINPKVWTQVMSEVDKVVGGDSRALVLKNDGTVWTAGNLNASAAGASNSTVPVQVLSNIKDIAISNNHGLAVGIDGTLYCAGYNGNGQLGLGDFTARTSWTVVGTGFSKCFASENFSLAIKTDGSLWATGLASSYQLGTGNTTRLNVWTQITSISGIVDIVANTNASMALAADGTLYGAGNKSKLGQGSSGTLTTFQVIDTNVVDIGAFRDGISYVKNDQLYVAGTNTYGALGDGTTTTADSVIITANL